MRMPHDSANRGRPHQHTVHVHDNSLPRPWAYSIANAFERVFRGDLRRVAAALTAEPVQTNSVSIKGRVRQLCRSGMRMRTPAPWREGYLEIDVANVDGRKVKRLALRALQSSPGMGHRNVLYRPEIVRVDADTMLLRGIECVQLADGLAALFQEWEVEL